MALRLIELFAPREEVARVPELLEGKENLGLWQLELDGDRAGARILVESRDTEAVSDLLTQKLGRSEGFRLVLLGVQATIPPPPEPTTDKSEDYGARGRKRVGPARISREELYQDVAGSSNITTLYLVTVVLSTVAAGVALAFALSVLVGLVVEVDPGSPQLGSRSSTIACGQAEERIMSQPEIGFPEPEEYDPYYTVYVQRVTSSNVVGVLQDQQFEVVELLRSLPEGQAGFRYAPEKWSLKEVIGHLLDTERVFAYRALSIARGEIQSLPGFDQDDYVVAGAFDNRTVTSLVGEYLHVRGATIALFESLDAEAWKRSGTANEVPVTVRALAFITAGHEAHHLAVLKEKYLA